MRLPLINHITNFIEDKDEDFVLEAIETLENLTNARSAAYTDVVGERASAEAQIGSALVNMLSVTEAYPDLKADANFRDLQQELSQLEDIIQRSLRDKKLEYQDSHIKYDLFELEKQWR